MAVLHGDQFYQPYLWVYSSSDSALAQGLLLSPVPTHPISDVPQHFACLIEYLFTLLSPSLDWELLKSKVCVCIMLHDFPSMMTSS